MNKKIKQVLQVVLITQYVISTSKIFMNQKTKQVLQVVLITQYAKPTQGPC